MLKTTSRPILNIRQVRAVSDTDDLTDLEVFARTIYGEARGEIHEGKIAVANVIMNRAKGLVKWWGNDVRTCCLHPFQFSCWLVSDPNRSKIMAVTQEDASYVECLALATDATNNRLDDVTNGATYYIAISMSEKPKWSFAKLPCKIIGNHEFFNNIA